MNLLSEPNTGKTICLNVLNQIGTWNDKQICLCFQENQVGKKKLKEIETKGQVFEMNYKIV